jgi:cystathionine gamma-lyase
MIDMTDFNKFKAAFRKNTKMVWVESPTNPTLKCLDIQRIAAFCKERGALLVVDNTFMSPAL